MESPVTAFHPLMGCAFPQYFPPGYRFCPLDEELIVHYLNKKIYNLPLPPNKMVDLKLYLHNPEELAERHTSYGENQWYFFTPRDKKYPNGRRPKRAAGGGYWKATGADRPVKYKGTVVGYRKALVFYTGKPREGKKTNWIMHEYRVCDAPPPTKRSADDMTLDDWVLCRIYQNTEKSIRVRHRNEESAQLDAPIQNIPTSFSENPPFDNFQITNNYNDQQAASSGCYGDVTPMVVQTNPTENIFNYDSLTENSRGFNSGTAGDEWASYLDDLESQNCPPI